MEATWASVCHGRGLPGPFSFLGVVVGGSTLWLRLNPGSRWSEANTPNDITAAGESEMKLSLILQQLLR